MPLVVCGVEPVKSTRISPKPGSMVTADFSVMTCPPGTSNELSPWNVPGFSLEMAVRVAASEREMISSDRPSMSTRL
jgi:hypothetical protein